MGRIIPGFGYTDVGESIVPGLGYTDDGGVTPPPLTGKIYLGAAEITAMKLGGGDVIRAYLGNEQVFGSPV